MNERLALPAPARAGVRRLVILAMAVALGLGLYRLGWRSLWQDEGFTWSTIDRSLPSMLALLVRDEAYQMLHSLLLWPWSRLAGSEAALRLPSVIAFVALAPAAFVAGRRLFGDTAGLLAAGLLALHGFLLEYAQEARSYALATALVTAAGAALVGAVADPSARRRRWWIAWSALAIWAHGFAALAIAAQVASLLLLPDEVRHRLRMAHGAAWIGALALPALLLPPFQVGAGDVWFITRPNLGSVVGFGWFAAGRNALLLPVYAAAVVFGAGVVIAATVRRRLRSVETWRWALPLAWFGVPPVLLMAASLLVDPIWVARYATWSVPAASILVGGALVRLVRAPRLGAVVAVALVLVSLRGTLKWFEEPMREDYRSAAAALAAQAEPGDVVLFTPDETRIPAEYYLRRAGVVPDGGLEPGWPAAHWGSWGTGDHRTADVEVAQVDALAARAQRLWVMEYGDDGINDPRLARLDDRFRVVSLKVHRGPIILIRYERR